MKRPPVKEGWFTIHPIALKRVEVVPAAWATAEIAQLQVRVEELQEQVAVAEKLAVSIRYRPVRRIIEQLEN